MSNELFIKIMFTIIAVMITAGTLIIYVTDILNEKWRAEQDKVWEKYLSDTTAIYTEPILADTVARYVDITIGGRVYKVLITP
ncbi:MAG: hypothetical protein WC309_04770 [Candidatus Paceibacterota bacterium]|jgi:hypothetical protein